MTGRAVLTSSQPDPDPVGGEFLRYAVGVVRRDHRQDPPRVRPASGPGRGNSVRTSPACHAGRHGVSAPRPGLFTRCSPARGEAIAAWPGDPETDDQGAAGALEPAKAGAPREPEEVVDEQ